VVFVRIVPFVGVKQNEDKRKATVLNLVSLNVTALL